jgi:hypothetical protein
VEAEVGARAIAAASSIGAELGLAVDDAVVVQNSNKLGLRLVPCDVFARVAPVGQEVAALEVELAQRLAAAASPVARLEPRVEPGVYERDGFAVTFWTYYDVAALQPVAPAEYAEALRRLHAAMRGIDVVTPDFTERVAEAERLVADPVQSPMLAGPDRELLATTLQSSLRQVQDCSAAEQLLHGEPHAGNVLNSHHGPLFVDLETCCRGPIEFDVAHVPAEVSALYPGADQRLVDECRRLVLAMVAAWRWDARDQFPNGLQHGRRILALLREGSPWPALGSLGDGATS